tara:strand:+ start:1009 stop:1236 length:228 start_codon:yes stop_codon:yes gene_type:complete
MYNDNGILAYGTTHVGDLIDDRPMTLAMAQAVADEENSWTTDGYKYTEVVPLPFAGDPAALDHLPDNIDLDTLFS